MLRVTLQGFIILAMASKKILKSLLLSLKNWQNKIVPVRNTIWEEVYSSGKGVA